MSRGCASTPPPLSAPATLPAEKAAAAGAAAAAIAPPPPPAQSGSCTGDSGPACYVESRIRRMTRLPAYLTVAAGLSVAALPLSACGMRAHEGDAADAVPVADWASPTLGTMKWIPAGRLTMGSASSEPFRDDDESQYVATLTRGYWLMEHEVTQGEWAAVMGLNPSYFSRCGGMCPVEMVSWMDAVSFAERASARDGVTYNLPTEAQWEYAARAEGYLYAGSNEPTSVGWTKITAARKRTRFAAGRATLTACAT
ncbi:MAG: formylglycine-generating enzyme family protein [Myxococcales bacterium]|nr:formylglycine-generating enzyme family protein [Myxococcales bacterium]